MRIAGRAVVVIALLMPASVAHAQAPDFAPLGQGAFPQLGFTWQANAAPPNGILFDFFNGEGSLSDSYETTFTAPPRRGMNAVGQRPFGLPSTAAVVYGVVGAKVKKVKLAFVGGARRTVKPVSVPAAWGYPGRPFALGLTIEDRFASQTQVVSRIRGLDRKGKVVFTTTDLFTNPF